jgi:hypothetical protein
VIIVYDHLSELQAPGLVVEYSMYSQSADVRTQHELL